MARERHPRQFGVSRRDSYAHGDEILARRGGDPPTICGSSPPAFRCGAWRIPPRSRAACISWHPSGELCDGAHLSVDGGNDATAGPYPVTDGSRRA